MKNSHKIDFSTWVEPEPLLDATAPQDIVSRVENKQQGQAEEARQGESDDEQKDVSPSNHKKQKESTPAFDPSMLIGLLGNNGNKNQMDMIMKLVQGYSKGSSKNNTLMSFLPLLMNGSLDNLFSNKKQAPSDKIINLKDYKIIK